MQVHDAQILRGAAIPTAVVGVLLLVMGGVVAGTKGVIGAALGVVLVAAFFTAGLVVIGWASKINPMMMMNVALFTYLVKIALLFVLLMMFQDTKAFDTKVFALSLLVSTLVWIGAEVRAFSRLKILYVDPDGKPSP
jgi:ATP synthase protein I